MPRHVLAPPPLTGPLAELRWWPWQELAKYPHLRPEEAEVMSDLIRATPGWQISVCYDAGIGPAGCEIAENEAQLRAIAQGVTRCRIDALAWDGASLWLIELKVYALPSAVGQVITYRCLLLDDLGSAVPLQSVVVARSAHRAAILCAARYEIGIAIATSTSLEIL